MQEPAFTGLLAAYYMGSDQSDHSNVLSSRVQPGDIILVHAGVYLSDRHHYFNRPPGPGVLSLGTLFDGTYYLTQRGTPEKPIVIKGAGDGEVIFDGDGAQTCSTLWRRTTTTSKGSRFEMPILLSSSGSRGSWARAGSF